MARKFVPLFLILAFILAACIPVTTPVPTSPPVPSEPPVSPPPPEGLTVDMLYNHTYLTPASGQTITLVDRMYASGSDPSAADYLQVVLDSRIAFGDLDFDGVQDAAVLLSENTGGTGVFVSLLAILDVGGSPWQAASVLIDDRPVVNNLTIQNGEILMDTVLHGPEDPGCCPNMTVGQGYRLYNRNELVLTSWAGQTYDGQPRQINITNPLDLQMVSYPLTVTGGVTVGPFENTLAYNVYTPQNELVTGGAVMTDSPDMGMPGNFSLTFDLTMAGVTGLVRVEFIEYSMMDGSILTLDSVLINVP